MIREVSRVSCGQASVQSGDAVCRQYCAEHHLLAYGDNPDASGGLFGCYFEKTNGILFVSRNLSAHLESNVIDDIRNGGLVNLFHPDFLLSSKEDAANNFARGHYNVGKEIIDKVNDRMRKIVDNCDNVQGFVVNHSVGGGAGS